MKHLTVFHCFGFKNYIWLQTLS